MNEIRRAHTCIDQVAPFADACNRLLYSPRADFLILYHDRLESGAVVEVEGWFGYRVAYDKSRVVAIEIHGFKRLFLPQYPQLRPAWRQYHSPMYRVLQRRETAGAVLLDRVIQAVQSLSALQQASA